jgi:hypothetical protein
LTGATIEEVGITANEENTAIQAPVAVKKEDINVSITTNTEANDEIPYNEERLDEETRAILNARIALSTRSG